MGGYGSGRYGGRPAVEHLLSLNVNRLNRYCSLLRGWSGSWTWHDADGDKIGSVSLQAGQNQITASGTLDGEPWKQSCSLTWTPCHFGGSRPWFRCPYCYGRVGKLYIGDSGLACRKCYRLNYSSTREDDIGRAGRKLQKLEARLDEDRAKPKGMHWRTYERLIDQLVDVEEEQNRLFIIGAQRILGW